MNFIFRFLFELQEMSLLAARAVTGVFRKPRYVPETISQMDYIGVGSMTIIILTGFFTGGVLTLQTHQTLESYGAVDQLGYLVSISLVRELGPVLSALMVTGRVVSAISAELGSMVVSEQIDAMRALGTDPIRKLVAPRIMALLITLPLLTHDPVRPASAPQPFPPQQHVANRPPLGRTWRITAPRPPTADRPNNPVWLHKR